MGGAWAGLWVAVLPHKGHKGHKPATSQLQGNHKGHKPARGKRWRAGGVLGLLSYQPQVDP